MRHCVLTLVERATGYAVIRKLTARNMAEATKAIKHFMARNWRRIKTINIENAKVITTANASFGSYNYAFAAPRTFGAKLSYFW